MTADAPTKRVRFVETRELYVDLPAEDADAILATRDITDLVDDYGRMKRIAGGDLNRHSYGELRVEEAANESLGGWGDPEALDGTTREQWLWTARSKLAAARHVLSRARYREGNCPELDEANRDLGRIEERLRVMALAVDGLGPDCRPLAGDQAPDAPPREPEPGRRDDPSRVAKPTRRDAHRADPAPDPGQPDDAPAPGVGGRAGAAGRTIRHLLTAALDRHRARPDVIAAMVTRQVLEAAAGSDDPALAGAARAELALRRRRGLMALVGGAGDG